MMGNAKDRQDCQATTWRSLTLQRPRPHWRRQAVLLRKLQPCHGLVCTWMPQWPYQRVRCRWWMQQRSLRKSSAPPLPRRATRRALLTRYQHLQRPSQSFLLLHLRLSLHKHPGHRLHSRLPMSLRLIPRMGHAGLPLLLMPTRRAPLMGLKILCLRSRLRLCLRSGFRTPPCSWRGASPLSQKLRRRASPKRCQKMRWLMLSRTYTLWRSLQYRLQRHPRPRKHPRPRLGSRLRLCLSLCLRTPQCC
mmetsp:Transcript_17689/g.37578  ORF Transcript_17689/g.37578 Transcript_17689/m.37578 type:complete len:248 (+) Transcript_17689:697-1440(+)